MKTREAAGSVTIDLPPATVWERLRDLSRAHDYVPGVVDTRMDSAQHEGVGASRTVTMKNGMEMQETVTGWADGKHILLRLHKGDKPAMPVFSEFFFRYAIVPEGNAQTRLDTALIYRPRLGPVGWLVGKLAHNRMAGSAQDVAQRLKEHLEQKQG